MKKLVHTVLEQGKGAEILQIWLRNLPTAKFRDLLLRPLQRYLSFVAAHQHSDVRPLFTQVFPPLSQSCKVWLAKEQECPFLLVVTCTDRCPINSEFICTS